MGDVSLLWRAAERLGIGGEAGRSAEAAGLIVLGAHVRFPHPLVRSAVYRAADAGDRRDVHLALAESTDPVLDPDRRAWHRAHATATPDEAVAAEMARSAGRAQGRGGLAAAAAFLQRATELTPDPAMRVERALAAAQAKLDVADAASATELLAAAELGPVDELNRARLERLRAEIVFVSRRGREAPPLLLEAARRLAPLDARMARATYLQAIASAMSAGRLGSGADVREVAEAARASTGTPAAPTAADQLLDALVIRFTEGYAASVAPLSRALHAIGECDGDGEERHWLWLACRLAQDLWDDELWCALATRGVRVARETGALSLLSVMANQLAAFHIHAGAFASAAALIEEVDAIAKATGLPPLQVLRDLADRGARRAGAGPVRPRMAEPDDARRGPGDRHVLAADRDAAQQPRPVRRGAAGRAAGRRARGRDGVRRGPGRADRGRRPRRPAGSGRRRARTPDRTHAGRAAPTGRSGSKRAVARC